MSNPSDEEQQRMSGTRRRILSHDVEKGSAVDYSTVDPVFTEVGDKSVLWWGWKWLACGLISFFLGIGASLYAHHQSTGFLHFGGRISEDLTISQAKGQSVGGPIGAPESALLKTGGDEANPKGHGKEDANAKHGAEAGHHAAAPGHHRAEGGEAQAPESALLEVVINDGKKAYLKKLSRSNSKVRAS